MTRRAGWFILSFSLLIGCGGGRGAGAVSDDSGAAAMSPRRSTLLADEIKSVAANNVHDAITRLRPEWLRRRGQLSFRSAGEELVVYLDGVRLGGAESLRRLDVASVMAIEMMNGSQATMRYGTGHAGGAIVVRTR